MPMNGLRHNDSQVRLKCWYENICTPHVCTKNNYEQILKLSNLVYVVSIYLNKIEIFLNGLSY